MARRNVIEVRIEGKDNTKGAFDGVLGNLAKLGLAAQGVKVITSAVSNLGGALFDLAKDAAPLEGIQKAFDGINKSIGKSSGDMLSELQKASKGMITNEDLMKRFNLAAQLVSKQFATELPEALQYFTKIASATGVNLDYLLDSYVRGTGRLSPLILDNLGVQIKLGDAYEAFAKSVGKSTDELTKNEQMLAVQAAVMEQLRLNTEAIPDITELASTKFGQLGTTIENLKDKIGLALLPTFGFLSSRFNEFIQHIAPGVEQAFKTINDAILLILVGSMSHGTFDESPLLQTFLEIHGIVERIRTAIEAANLDIAGGADPISAFLDRFANAFGINNSIFSNAKYAWDNYIQPIIDAVIDVARESIGPGLKAIGDGLGGFFQNLRGADTGSIKNLSTLVEFLIRIGGLAIGGALEGIGNALPGIGAGIRDIVDSFSAYARGNTKQATEEMRSGLGKLAMAFLEFPAGIANRIIDAVEAITGMDLASAEQVINAFPNMFKTMHGVLKIVLYDIETSIQLWVIGALQKLQGLSLGILNILGPLTGIMSTDELNALNKQAKELEHTAGRINLASTVSAMLRKGAMEGFDQIHLEGLFTQIAFWPNEDEIRGMVMEGAPDFVANFQKALDHVISQGDFKVAMLMGSVVKFNPIELRDEFMSSLTKGLRDAQSTLEQQQILEYITVPMSLILETSVDQVLGQITQQIFNAEGALAARGFVEDVAVPVLMNIGHPELIPNLVEQFNHMVDQAGQFKTYEADPKVNPTIKIDLPSVTNQFERHVRAAAQARVYAADAATNVTVTASSVNTSGFVATVIGRIREAIQSIAGMVSGIINNAVSDAGSRASSDLGIISPTSTRTRDFGGHVWPGVRYFSGTPETFVPGAEGEMVLPGNNQPLVIQFNGTGGPTNEAEAEDAGFMIVHSLRARGIPVGGT